MVPRNRVQKVCNTCGESFEVVASRAETAKYCSRECYWTFNPVVINGGVASIALTDKAHDKTIARTLVDTADLPAIKEAFTRLYASWWEKIDRYRACGKIDGKNVSLHRFLMDPPPGYEVDHISGDTLDNRRANLRVCTPAQNRQNPTRLRSHNTSGFRGVTYKKDKRKWRARITVNKREILVGYFDTAEAAGEAAAAARRKYMSHTRD